MNTICSSYFFYVRQFRNLIDNFLFRSQSTVNQDICSRHYVKKYNLPPKRFSPESLRWIREHWWEGNVRELDNAVHREVVLADGDEIRFDVLNNETAPTPPTATSSADDYATLDFQSAKAKAVHDFERGYLTRILQIAHGNVSAAARIAEKERRAFGKLLKKHQISREQFK